MRVFGASTVDRNSKTLTLTLSRRTGRGDRSTRMLNGFLILDKPVGPSSAYAIGGVKRLIPRGTKIGHAGTLDPLASGVLVTLIGKATKQSDRVMTFAKQYEATITFGATSATDDAEGPFETFPNPASPPTEGRVLEMLKRFEGHIEQMPPAFSALKIAGKRACDRTRDGEVVVLKPRIIRIDRTELVSYAFPQLSIRVDCGKGTYIRSLARDIGATLGVGGYLSALRRTAVGPFTVERGAALEQLKSDGVEKWLIPIEQVVEGLRDVAAKD